MFHLVSILTVSFLQLAEILETFDAKIANVFRCFSHATVLMTATIIQMKPSAINRNYVILVVCVLLGICDGQN